jgi:hypothetical protein
VAKNQMRAHRNRRARTSAAIALAALMLGSAATAQDGKIDFQTVPLPRNLGLPNSHYSRSIRSSQEYDAWANTLTEVIEPLPTVDFERFTLLVSSAGYKEHGPVIVTFDSVTDVGNVIKVHVSVTSPATCPKDIETGHYAAMALIPRTDKPIQFDVSNRDTNCTY